ncbi:MAG: hypothetical protein ACI4F9_01380 [Lachnospiraceae bacterium]
MGKWIDDIREKTKNMDRNKTIEYIANYYWYHILLFLLFVVIVILFLYHIFFGDRDMKFHCVIINQEVDYDRDAKLEKDFASFANQNPKKISVDSDYLISYGGVHLKGVNESSYEKFFFNWSSGEIDAVIMPESFYEYCKSLGAEFEELSGFLLAKDLQKIEQNKIGIKEKDSLVGIYVEETKLMKYLRQDVDEKYILAFPNTGKHKVLNKKFLEMML